MSSEQEWLIKSSLEFDEETLETLLQVRKQGYRLFIRSPHSGDTWFFLFPSGEQSVQFVHVADIIEIFNRLITKEEVKTDE